MSSVLDTTITGMRASSKRRRTAAQFRAGEVTSVNTTNSSSCVKNCLKAFSGESAVEVAIPCRSRAAPSLKNISFSEPGTRIARAFFDISHLFNSDFPAVFVTTHQKCEQLNDQKVRKWQSLISRSSLRA